jgi:DNA replication protein DnaC
MNNINYAYSVLPELKTKQGYKKILYIIYQQYLQTLQQIDPKKYRTIDDIPLKYQMNRKQLINYISAGIGIRYIKLFVAFDKDESFKKRANKLIQSPNEIYFGNGVFIHGGFGIGKTSLGAFVTKRAIDKNISSFMITVSNLLEYKKDSFNGIQHQAIEIVKHCQFLMLDDIGKEYKSEYQTNYLDNLIRTRNQMALSTNFNSNHSILELVKKNYLLNSTKELLKDMCIEYQLRGENYREKLNKKMGNGKNNNLN